MQNWVYKFPQMITPTSFILGQHKHKLPQSQLPARKILFLGLRRKEVSRFLLSIGFYKYWSSTSKSCKSNSRSSSGSHNHRSSSFQHCPQWSAKRIVELAGPPFQKVFFTNGGADAIENAIRMARLHTGKDKILSTYRSYHGNTGAAINSTGDPRRFPNEFAHGHVHFWGPYLYRSAFWATTPEEECARALEHLEQTIIFEGPKNIAAVLLETIPGTAGILVPPQGYLDGVRALCDKYEILWIADEVMAGFGRSGRWFAFQHSQLSSRSHCLRKGRYSGYIPLGGVIIRPE